MVHMYIVKNTPIFFVVCLLLLGTTTTCFGHQCWPSSGFFKYNLLSMLHYTCNTVNYLEESDKESQLDSLLKSYNLFSIVKFPIRTYNNSSSAIANIFIDTTKIDTYEVIPVINKLSDHNAQIIILNTSNNKSHEYQVYFRRNINKYTMA